MMFFLKELSFAVFMINLKFALSYIGGFGVSNLIKNQRLFYDNLIGTNKVKHKKYQYQEVEDCSPVDSYYFKGVIDNFASVDDQKPWEGTQRYWINQELWGGPGFPIFAFIGGEWVESCDTLKNNSVCAFTMLFILFYFLFFLKFYIFKYFALFHYYIFLFYSFTCTI